MSDASLIISDLLPSRSAIDPAELSFHESPGLASTMLGFVGSKVEETLDSVLRADVLGLVALAWTKVNALRDAAAEGRAKCEPRHVFLGKHEIESESKVDVRVEFSQLPGAQLAAPFTDELRLKLKATFQSVGLTIDNGFIVAVEAGKGEVEAQLCYSNNKLLGASTAPVALPAKYKLQHPVVIELSPAHPAEVAEVARAT